MKTHLKHLILTIATTLTIITATPGHAQAVTTEQCVTGSPDGTLNLRSTPSSVSDSNVIAVFVNGDCGIRFVSSKRVGVFAKVSTPEGAGWVKAKWLKPRTVSLPDPASVAPPVSSKTTTTAPSVDCSSLAGDVAMRKGWVEDKREMLRIKEVRLTEAMSHGSSWADRIASAQRDVQVARDYLASEIRRYNEYVARFPSCGFTAA